MSVICITEHDEVIYDVIKKPKKIPPHIKLFEPNLDPNLNFDNLATAKQGTMGPSEYKKPNPKEFLRKDPTRRIITVKKKKFDRPHRESRLPPVPRHIVPKEKPAPEKDFVKRNYIHASKLEPKPVIPKFVDTRGGQTHLVEYPYHIYRKKFGRPPPYLLRKIETVKVHVQNHKDVKVLENPNKCRYVTRQERQNILNGLKKNWQQMQKEYQLLPMITDTIPKVIRKTKMENDLRDLEKDIVLIENHPYIYIEQDEEDDS